MRSDRRKLYGIDAAQREQAIPDVNEIGWEGEGGTLSFVNSAFQI